VSGLKEGFNNLTKCRKTFQEIWFKYRPASWTENCHTIPSCL